MTFDFNTIIGVSGSIFGLFGIIISIYSYKKSKKTKKLAVNSESTILISETLSKYENLKISYNNEDIKSLTSTIVQINNIGSDIVEPSDVASSSPIVIKTTQKFLFNDASQYEIKVSNNKNVVKLSKLDEATLQVLFDFLNPKDEISITILHTGEISVDGSLKTTEIKNYTKKNYENNNTSLYDYKGYYYTNKTLHILLFLITFIPMLFIIIIPEISTSTAVLLALIVVSISNSINVIFSSNRHIDD